MKKNLAFIKGTFGFIPKVIESLEKRNLRIFEATNMIDECLEKLQGVEKAKFAVDRLTYVFYYVFNFLKVTKKNRNSEH